MDDVPVGVTRRRPGRRHRPVASGTLTPQFEALAGLQHSPNIPLIPGTSSSDHLRQNIAAVALPPDAVAELDAI